MPQRIKSVIGQRTGASSVATQFKKSAATSANAFMTPENRRRAYNIRRKKSNGGSGG